MSTSPGAATVPPVEPEAPSLAEYAAVLARRRATIVVCALAGLVAALAYVAAGTTSSTSSTTVLVGEIPGESQLSGGRPQLNMQTQVELARSSEVVEAVADELGVEPGAVRAAASAAPADESANVLVVTYSASNAGDAQRGSQLLAEEYLRLRGRIGTDNLGASLSALRAEEANLEQELAQLTETLATTPAGPAATRAQLRANQVSDRLATVQSELFRSEVTVLPGRIIAGPSEPADPGLGRSLGVLLLGLAAGALVGVFVAFARDRLDRRVRSLDDLRALGLADLGVVAGVPAPRRVLDAGGGEPFEDQVRAGMSVLTALERVGARTCVVVEPGRPARRVGGAYTALVAAVIAEAVPSVTVIAGDLRDDAVSRVFRLADRPGLREYCSSSTMAPEKVAVALDDVPGVTVVPAGSGDEPSMRVLRSERFAKLLEVGRSRSDVVLVAAPPMGVAADALLLGADVDAALFVLTPESEVDDVREAQLEIERLGTPLVGFVLVRPGHRDRAA